MIITQKELKETVHYNPETGDWTHLRLNRLIKTTNVSGYLVIRINHKTYYAHRLAFLYMLNLLPEEHTDHINGNKDDCRWDNLRLATIGQNLCNIGKPSHNTFGVKGVSYCKARNNLVCQVKHLKKLYSKYFSLGDEDKAIEWVRNKREQLHGEYTNHGLN